MTVLGDKATLCKARHTAVTALLEAVQPSAAFTAHEKKRLQHELERLRREQQQYTKQFSSRLHMYEHELKELEASVQVRQRIVDTVCEACPELLAHMDACQVFMPQHSKLASQIQKTKDAILER